jgi:S-adenosylmethionine:tRNA ribosyltransferase-isomerase
MVFNETKVIPARILIRKPTGAQIEIFCLEPSEPSGDYQLALQQGPGCEWLCLVGNARRWKEEDISTRLNENGHNITLHVTKILRKEDKFRLRFDWEPQNLSFSEILEAFGKIPLPPYIHRESEENDRIRYQTVFARQEGSVAAPTAGLHFTQNILDELTAKGSIISRINLHVGAGTFKPVTSQSLAGHRMHTEYVHVSADFINRLINHWGKPVILVGTTTVRTVESLYWQGVKWMKKKPVHPNLEIFQWDPYEIEKKDQAPVKEALEALKFYMSSNRLDSLHGFTSLLIAPTYSYKVPDAMITNFHMPKSTLLLLVAAFIGEDWRKAYQYAISKDFRFLSYGDSCLFFKPQSK